MTSRRRFSGLMIGGAFLGLTVPGLVLAGGTRFVVTPFDGSSVPVRTVNPGPVFTVPHAPAIRPQELVPILQAGADHVVAQQCADGGFGWPHDDCSTTYHNITAPILMGVLNAHRYTMDPAHLAAAVTGGDFEVAYQWSNGEPRFGTQTPRLLQVLSTRSGDPSYAEHAAQYFFDTLQAGTYGPSDWDTAGYIAAIFAYRTGALVNLRPWEFCTLVTAAEARGNPGQADSFAQAALDGLASLDNSDPGTVYSDIIGLAGGIMALSRTGWTTFPAISAPLHSGVNGIDSLAGLVGLLLTYQNDDGSWNWHSNLAVPDLSDKDLQTTAYAILALVSAEPLVAGSQAPAILSARDWLASMQLPGGGFPEYPGGNENTGVEGEVLWALGASMDFNALPVPALERPGLALLGVLLALAGIAVRRKTLA